MKFLSTSSLAYALLIFTMGQVSSIFAAVAVPLTPAQRERQKIQEVLAERRRGARRPVPQAPQPQPKTSEEEELNSVLEASRRQFELEQEIKQTLAEAQEKARPKLSENPKVLTQEMLSRGAMLEILDLAKQLPLKLVGGTARQVMVRDQGGTSACGLHCLKNGQALYAWLTLDPKMKTEQELTKALQAEPFKDVCFEDGGQPNEVYGRIGRYGIKPETISILFPIDGIYEDLLVSQDRGWEFARKFAFFISDEHDANFIRALEKFMRGEDITHIFVLGFSHQDINHWFVVVAQQIDNQVNYFAADSLGNTPDNIVRFLPYLHAMLKGGVLTVGDLTMAKSRLK